MSYADDPVFQELVKSARYDEFLSRVCNLNYEYLYELERALRARLRDISAQLESATETDRNDFAEWERRARYAMQTTRSKLAILSVYTSQHRASRVRIFTKDYSSRKSGIIACLVSLIENTIGTSNLVAEEAVLLDAARHAVELDPPAPVLSDWEYRSDDEIVIDVKLKNLVASGVSPEIGPLVAITPNLLMKLREVSSSLCNAVNDDSINKEEFLKELSYKVAGYLDDVDSRI